MRIEKAVVLLSGGMDSVTLLHDVSRRQNVPAVYTLTFNYGQKHIREIEEARWNAGQLGVADHCEVDLSSYGSLIAGGSSLTNPDIDVPDMAELSDAQREQPPTYVPNRNMALLSLAAAYAEAKGARDVFYAAQAQDRYGYWDCTADFLDAMNAVLGLNRRQHVTVHAPYVDFSKSDVLKIGLEIGVDYSHTWTCYRGGTAPCGSCPSCVERAAAFSSAGVADPLVMD